MQAPSRGPAAPRVASPGCFAVSWVIESSEFTWLDLCGLLLSSLHSLTHYSSPLSPERTKMAQSGQRCQVAGHYLQLLTWMGEPQSHEMACQRQRKHPSHLQEEREPGFASVGSECTHREGGEKTNGPGDRPFSAAPNPGVPSFIC